MCYTYNGGLLPPGYFALVQRYSPDRFLRSRQRYLIVLTRLFHSRPPGKSSHANSMWMTRRWPGALDFADAWSSSGSIVTTPPLCTVQMTSCRRPFQSRSTRARSEKPPSVVAMCIRMTIDLVQSVAESSRGSVDTPTGRLYALIGPLWLPPDSNR